MLGSIVTRWGFIMCMFHTLTKKTLCDMLSTAVLCYIKNMFCIAFICYKELAYEICHYFRAEL
jgi:hypothetical protein